jgi:Protein of unknown function (DUF2892)
MTVERWIRIFAGTFILLSVLLGAPASPLYVSQWWLAFTAFVGANLFQYAFTNTCPLGWILRKLGVPETQVAHP